MGEVGQLFTRRAALLHELASLEERLGAALERPATPPQPDETLDLEAAATFMGEAPETFRRRPEYLKASLRRRGERRHRYSRSALDRIRQDRLAGNA